MAWVSEDLKAVVSELFDVEYLKINDSQLVQAVCCRLMHIFSTWFLEVSWLLGKEVERLVEKFSEILENNSDKSGPATKLKCATTQLLPGFGFVHIMRS